VKIGKGQGRIHEVRYTWESRLVETDANDRPNLYRRFSRHDLDIFEAGIVEGLISRRT
jgi:hypothetical protein